MKDYYQILEVAAEASEEQIRKQYRRLAMQHHPDHNPGNPEAEARFKEIAEAYGVLTDPVKREQYDTARRMGADYAASGQSGGFHYSQEDILRDLFQDPRFQQMFSGLLQEFARKGFRANPQFVKQSFFGNRGGMVIGGLFFLGSLAGPVIRNSARQGLGSSKKKGLLRSLGTAFGTLLSGGKRRSGKPSAIASGQPAETTYTAYLSASELRDGKVIQLVTQGPDGQERLQVRVPPGSRIGQRLRLKGKGEQGALGRGDLYLLLAEG
ncbi:MAG: DnaJ domain-containing protein [Desulfopila sp.]